MSGRGLARFVLRICVAAGFGALLPATAGAVTYSTPGTYTLVVPSGMGEVTISAMGGGGGEGGGPGGSSGKAGLEQATFAVTPGQTLSITVAGKGGAGVGGSTSSDGGQGGEGGGGAGGGGYSSIAMSGLGGGGGGGASSVSIDGNLLLVAGGGGGGGGWSYAGWGGNDGSAGSGSSDSGGQGGGPGTLTTGGASGQGGSYYGPGASGTSGSKGQGGPGGGPSGTFSGGGGGGGGYYGGGGGGGGPCDCGSDRYSSGGGGGGGSDFVDPSGACVTSQPGANSGNGSVTIDFTSSAARDLSGSASPAAGAALSPCKLYVKIKWPDMSTPRPAGLTFQPSQPSLTADGGPLFAERVGSSDNLRCVSGCTPLTIIVKALKPGSTSTLVSVENATLTASVDPITTNPLLDGSRQPAGYLCTTGSNVTCGSDLPGRGTELKTDQHGTLHLVYWSPGVIQSKAPAITVKATETCNGTGCPISKRQGFDRQAPNVKPIVLATGSFTLDKGQIDELEKWADASSPDEVLDAYEANKAPGASSLVQSLGEHALDIKVPSPVSLALLAYQVYYDSLNQVEQVEHAAVTDFMYHLGLPEVGLGSTNMNWDRKGVDPAVQGDFLARFANWSIITGHKDPGALFQFAQEIDKYGPYAANHTFTASIAVTDVSYCKEPINQTTGGNADDFYGCGPGYFTSFEVPPACGSGKEIRNDENADPNIKGYLYVDFIGRIASQKQPLVNDAFTVPYNPYDWMASYECIKPKQPGG